VGYPILYRKERTENTYGVLVGKIQGKRPLGRHRLRWEHTKLTLDKQDGRVLTGSIWVRIGTRGWLL